MIPEAREVVGEDYEAAIAGLGDSVHNVKRLLAGVWMLNYPNVDSLKEQARTLRRSLGSAAVEVNIITEDTQLTIVAVPGRTSVTVTPINSSLCVLTAGTGKALQVSDLQNDPLVPDSVKASKWTSWCSVPLVINGYTIGSICGLEEDRPRSWTELDEALLNQTAVQVGREVDDWAHEQGYV